MNIGIGYALGALFCLAYAFIVGGLALTNNEGLFKLVRMKLGKKTTDKTAKTLSIVMSVIMLCIGIFLLIFGFMQG
jgi:UPF0716 family protein affecting phage T7 exclusion